MGLHHAASPYVLHVGHQEIQVPWVQRDQKVIQVQMEKEDLQALLDYLDVEGNKVHQAILGNLDLEAHKAPEDHLGLKVKMVLMEDQVQMGTEVLQDKGDKWVREGKWDKGEKKETVDL
ncbi:hypothetical protein chiPu_0004684 [Chiloscyllium punctatum]|uniref:Uncharacterized protein n=1 Tax=Chiloscyllium punctatum TaxID=137246 RepID=A0A401S7B3_CHIPU|nr:hypothetical protein [Chiloscyllium punctatum]